MDIKTTSFPDNIKTGEVFERMTNINGLSKREYIAKWLCREYWLITGCHDYKYITAIGDIHVANKPYFMQMPFKKELEKIINNA